MKGGKAQTREKAIRDFVAETVCIPMNMHIGAPSNPIVKKGDRVRLGQVIAEAAGGIGIPVHASLSGEVTEVANKQMLGTRPSLCVTIKGDGQDDWVDLQPLGDVETVPVDAIVPAIRAAASAAWEAASPPTPS